MDLPESDGRAAGLHALSTATGRERGERLSGSWPRTGQPGRGRPCGTVRGPDDARIVVHGELDPIPEEFARLLVEHLREARYVWIAGASHFSFLEDTDLFVQAAEPLLREQILT
jgi:pimeloyl-ACP methyl ester carboxylesterase